MTLITILKSKVSNRTQKPSIFPLTFRMENEQFVCQPYKPILQICKYKRRNHAKIEISYFRIVISVIQSPYLESFIKVWISFKYFKCAETSKLNFLSIKLNGFSFMSFHGSPSKNCELLNFHLLSWFISS